MGKSTGSMVSDVLIQQLRGSDDCYRDAANLPQGGLYLHDFIGKFSPGYRIDALNSRGLRHFDTVTCLYNGH